MAAFKSQIEAAPDPHAALQALTQQIDNLRSPLRTAAVSSRVLDMSSSVRGYLGVSASPSSLILRGRFRFNQPGHWGADMCWSMQAFSIEDVIRPSETRPLLCKWVKNMYSKLEHGDTLGPGGSFVP